MIRDPHLLIGNPDLDDRAFSTHGRGRFAGVCVYGGKGGGRAPAPDPAIGQAALENIQLGKDWLQFAREQFAVGNERQKETDALSNRVIEQQIRTQDEANQWARGDRDRMETIFRPVEDRFVQEASNYDTPEKQEAQAAEARADVVSSAEAQRATNVRQMAAMGMRPDSGRFQGITRTNDLNTALAAAGAQNNARQVVRDKGLSLRADVANMGRGLGSSAAGAFGIGLNAGNSATGNRASANQQWGMNNQIMTNGFQGNISANSSGANILNNLYGNQVAAWDANRRANSTSAAGLGNLFGTLGSAWITSSDIRVKEDVQRVGQLPNGIPIYTFRYTERYRPLWGRDIKIGVMAQDVEKVIPDAVVTGPDGIKMVDYAKVVSHV